MKELKKKYQEDNNLINKEIDELAVYYGNLANKAKLNKDLQMEPFYNGIVEGLNKMYKLLFVSDVDIKELKERK